jgi:hypothetical protein
MSPSYIDAFAADAMKEMKSCKTEHHHATKVIRKRKTGGRGKKQTIYEMSQGWKV